ncbi:MAG: AAA family ATPase [Gammaproteobacteria bacterium]|nr:AAA family ATPase [Gammaproteobacteria bacterium]
MPRPRLPIGIQDFQTLRESGCYYVDKTPLIHQLVRQGRYYFLSRPRRFGKSLLLDTLRELFAGNEPLFRGLAIHGKWDWTNKHPIVHLSFGGKNIELDDLETDVLAQLGIIERNAGLAPPDKAMSGPARLRDLLDRLHGKTGRRVVVLVDEYDKPILDALDKPEIAEANREYLRGFYGVIKDCARLVRFVFVTGISMFTRVSLFSGLNNLENISLDPAFATICGYTDRDLDAVFAAELDGLDRDEVRHWYNGYHWRGEEKLYNPYDILLLFRSREFEPHWFETGTPKMLYRQIVRERRNPMELERLAADSKLLSSFDVSDIDLRALMFQAGYLTIAREERIGAARLFALAFPNLEVRLSFSKGLLAHAGQDQVEVIRSGNALLELLAANDFAGFGERLKSYLAGVPHQWYDSSPIDRFEAHYASMLYLCFRAVGADLAVEDASSHGRADMVVFQDGQVFVLEFKMVENGATTESTLNRAISQMRERGYAEKYRSRGEPIHLVAAAFGQKERNLLAVRHAQSEIGDRNGGNTC